MRCSHSISASAIKEALTLDRFAPRCQHTSWHRTGQCPPSTATPPYLGEPSRSFRENITYGNDKKFNRILKRRAANQQLDKKSRSTRRSSKPYLRERRHRHAARQPRGPGNLFLSKGQISIAEYGSNQFQDTEAKADDSLKQETRKKIGQGDGFHNSIVLGHDQVRTKRVPQTNPGLTMSFYGAEELRELQREYAS